MERMTREAAIEVLGLNLVKAVEKLDSSYDNVIEDGQQRWEAILDDDFGNWICAVYYQPEDYDYSPDSEWEIDHFEIEGALEQRYWVQKERIPGDTFQDILPAGTTEEEAIEQARKEWDHLTPGEQRHSTVTLCHGLVDVAQEITDPFGFGYNTIDWEEKK